MKKKLCFIKFLSDGTGNVNFFLYITTIAKLYCVQKSLCVNIDVGTYYSAQSIIDTVTPLFVVSEFWDCVCVCVSVLVWAHVSVYAHALKAAWIECMKTTWLNTAPIPTPQRYFVETLECVRMANSICTICLSEQPKKENQQLRICYTNNNIAKVISIICA